MTIEQGVKRAREAAKKLPPLVDRRRRAARTAIATPATAAPKAGRPATTP